MLNYTEIKASDLLAIYNQAAKELGRKSVNKFADKPTAIKRTQAIVEEAQKIEGFVTWMKSRDGQAVVAEARQSEPPPASALIIPPAPRAAALKAPKTKVEKVTKAKTVKGVRMDFNFKPFKSGQKEPKGEGSLRSLCLARLKDGAKFSTIVSLVERFDNNRGKGNAATIERRAYELVRIMHYQLGYGVKHDATSGMISVYTKE